MVELSLTSLLITSYDWIMSCDGVILIADFLIIKPRLVYFDGVAVALPRVNDTCSLLKVEAILLDMKESCLYICTLMSAT